MTAAIITATTMAVLGIAALVAYHSVQHHRALEAWRRQHIQAQLDRAAGREHRTEDDGYAELLERAEAAPLGYPYDWIGDADGLFDVAVQQAREEWPAA